MKRVSEFLGWVGSVALLIAIPKCPACLAAYALLWTGVSLSFTAASYLRYGAIALSLGAMAFLIAFQLRRHFRRAAERNNNTKRCHERHRHETQLP